MDPPSGLEPPGLRFVFGEAALEQGRVWRIGPSRPLVTRGKFAWRQGRRGRWRLVWSSVIAVWEEVQPQVLGALSLVLRPSFKLARFHEVLVQEFGPTNGTPKKEPQRSGLTTESCSDGQRLPAPLGRRSRRLDHRMLWDIEAAAQHTLSHALCEELPSQIGPRAD